MLEINKLANNSCTSVLYMYKIISLQRYCLVWHH